MQSPQQHPQTPAPVGFLPSAISWILQAIGLTVLLVVITQVDLEYSAKDVRTKLHYKGNVLIDLSRPHEK